MRVARLLPTVGISSTKEAEQRATSALLAILTVVRDLSVDLVTPLGASRAQRAVIEAYTETVFNRNGRKVRPDGLIRVTYGARSWSALVEVKTGEDRLDVDQLNAYWDVARVQKFDHVLSISNELSPMPGVHPTPGLRVRSNSPVQVSHFSWTAILTTAVRIKQHKGVSDPEQAWILDELIRYLEHPRSGALSFADMGPEWTATRDASRSSTLTLKDDGASDIAGRWDQLLRYAALKLGSKVGADVIQVLKKVEQDPKVRHHNVLDELVDTGILTGTLRVPGTAGDIDLDADLRAQQLCASMEVKAPDDRGAVGRVSWIVNQLKDAPGTLVIESYPKGARTPTTALIDDVREDRHVLLGGDKKPAAKFRLVARASMGQARKARGKKPGFIDTVLGLLDTFYGNVVQQVSAWTPSAPKLAKSPTPTEPVKSVTDDSDQEPEPSLASSVSWVPWTADTTDGR